MDEGTETFTILSGTTPIGSAVTVNVSAGASSAVYVLPAGTPAGIYIILAVYNGSTNFLSFTDNSEELVIQRAATAAAAASRFGHVQRRAENITLNATITSARRHRSMRGPRLSPSSMARRLLARRSR